MVEDRVELSSCLSFSDWRATASLYFEGEEVCFVRHHCSSFIENKGKVRAVFCKRETERCTGLVSELWEGLLIKDLKGLVRRYVG